MVPCCAVLPFPMGLSEEQRLDMRADESSEQQASAQSAWCKVSSECRAWVGLRISGVR